MTKNVVFLTGKSIGTGASDCIHLYRRIASFEKCGDVSIITQSTETYPEQAGCKRVVHLGLNKDSQDAAAAMTMKADLFVVVGMAPTTVPSASLLALTKQDCCIAIIHKGNLEMPQDVHRENVLKMRDMSVGTGLMFLSMYRWMMDIIEE